MSRMGRKSLRNATIRSDKEKVYVYIASAVKVTPGTQAGLCLELRV